MGRWVCSAQGSPTGTPAWWLQLVFPSHFCWVFVGTQLSICWDSFFTSKPHPREHSAPPQAFCTRNPGWLHLQGSFSQFLLVFVNPYLSNVSLATPVVSAGCFGGLIWWHFDLLLLSICYLPFILLLLSPVYWVNSLTPDQKHSCCRSFSTQLQNSCAKERWN